MANIIDACAAVPVTEPEDDELETAPAHPDPSSITLDVWRRVETAALGVVYKIQPSVASEHHRAAVIDYLQRLFRSRVGCQVFPFGSVPLKTYLPDGDIDLTAFGPTISDENLANEVCAILKSEEDRKDSEFDVKDVQYIHAEVKLVKCLVQNIVVDISVNQIGGLYTLCFLEKVDENFGKRHLFKRSLILIKDWCYYESRILGAHNGLISTYALEILVLYVFHIFHHSLNGPLSVLYRFLDYFSKFDWDQKGISLFGPVSLSSLPDLVTDPPAIHDDGFLAREKFLRECADAFSVPPRNSEKATQVFSTKFLNIVDPLKQNNNLGRSVSRGNFYRIRSAFDFGARKLGKVLQMPVCYTADEVNQFFGNTLKKNRTGLRPDVLVSSSDNGILTCHATNDSLSLGLDWKRFNNCSSPVYIYPCGDLSYQFNNINISDAINHDDSNLSHHGMPTKQFTGRSHHLFKDAKYHNEFSGSFLPPIEHYAYSSAGFVNVLATSNSTSAQENSQLGVTNNNILKDLTGDFETYFHNLQYAQGFQQDNPVKPYGSLAPASPQYQNTRPSNGQGRGNPYAYASMNGAVTCPPYPSGSLVRRPFIQPDHPMAMRASGTSTYFPAPKLRIDGPPAGRGGRGRNQFTSNNYRRFHHHVRTDMPAGMRSGQEWRHELP